MKKSRLKRWLSILLAAAMLTTGSAYDFSGIVNAEEPDYEVDYEPEGTTVSENGLPDVDEATEDDTTEDEDLLLIQDADSSTGVYYNAGSSGSGMTDFREETIYFVMTTRFYDGDPSNNVQCWDGKDKNGESDPPWRGDFKGLIEKLDYIKALGFTAVWITPVVKNASGYDYHGYHAINFKEVDPRYESGDCTYQDLIDAVHERGMKIIQDVVFQHTGNWGEENLYPMFTKSETNLDTTDCMQRNMDMAWDPNYDTFTPEYDRGRQQLRDRLKLMNADSDAGTKYDINDIYHHEGFVGSSFENPIVQYGHIHYADCMDLNTENPIVYHYLVDAYSDYIRMGVDAFRVDTVKHISRLTLNKAFNQQLNDAYNETHGTTGEGNFYMFGEVCTRWRGTWNSNNPSISCPFYTWKETEAYAWDDHETAAANTTNNASAKQHYKDNQSNTGAQPTNDNEKLRGNEYHTPDHSQHSGMNVIDFPMHWAFKNAGEAWQQALEEDPYYNDATFNVTYVDSHDYAPDNAPENVRYNGSTEQWAENLSLIFTFRGIPCIYYGSEIEFQKGELIDQGPSIPLAQSGRAYFGDLIEGSVNVTDFGRYNGASGAMAGTLNNPLSLHIQRLNRLRACIPALQKGQYSTEGCSGGMSFKRRYTDDNTDSFVLVAISSDATFSGIPGGTYVDAITGDRKENIPEGGTLTTSGIKGQGDLRVYVLDNGKAPFVGMIDGKSEFMSGGTDTVAATSPVDRNQGGGGAADATGITLDKTSVTLDLGGSVKLTATVAPDDANKSVRWSTSNDKVARVSSGTVTAVDEGTAIITATTHNGIEAKATITVSASGTKVESVTLTPKTRTLQVGDTLQMAASVNPANADPKYAKLTWKSSDTGVASVDSNGLVTAKKQGTATITASTAYFGKSDTATITVKGPTITYLDGDAVYFEKPAGWGNEMKAHFWTKDDSWTTKWPGLPMTLCNESAGIYGIKLPEGKSASELNVIFTDGAAQTGNITEVKVNGYYDQSGYVRTVDPHGGGDDPDDPIEISSFTANPASGSANPGSNVSLTAAATGGTGTLQYKFTAQQGSSGESTIQDYGNAKTATWTPQTAGTYTLKVYVKDSGNVIKDVTINYVVKDNAVGDINITSFTANPDSGSADPGSSVRLTAAATGGTGTLQYKFTARQGSDSESTIQEYGAAKTATWTPQTAGTYTLKVYVKDSNGKEETKTIANYVVKDTVVSITGFTAAPSGSVYKGNSVSLTATATGAGTLQYKFAIQRGSSGEITIRDYKDANTYTWTPQTAGTYTLKVYVKDSNDREETKTIANYEVKENVVGDINITSFTAAPDGSVYKGSSVSLTADATGGTAPLQYKFTALKNGSESTLQDYGNANTFTWTPKEAGTYTLKVYVKDSGSKSGEKTIANYQVKDTVSEDIQISFTNAARTYVYDGKEKKPEVTVKAGTKTLVKDTDYTLKYYNYINAGDKNSENPPKVVVSGKGNYALKIVNYELKFTIEKADKPEGAPAARMEVAAGTVADVFLAGNWKWSDGTKNQTITSGESTHAIAEYDGPDKENYNTKSVNVELIGTVCDHTNTEKETKTVEMPTCNKDGYTVEICKKCQTKVPDSIKMLDKLDHIGGTATCVSLPKCERCGDEYGFNDPMTHQHTELRGQRKADCQQEGHEGNLVCTDCGRTIFAGETIQKTDHDWDEWKVTKAATATEDGTKTRTCTVCSKTENETIPKTGGGSVQKPEENPKPGDSVTDAASKGTYKVTQADSTAKTVEFVSTTAASKTVSVPDTIVVKGTTYQVTAIAANAFKNNKTITSIKMGSNIKTIGNNAFSGCSKLKKVTLSKNTTTIGNNAFYKCTSLTSITIPAKVSKIGSKAFYGCKKLKKITIKTTKLTSKKVGSQAFKGIAEKATIKVPKTKLTDYKKFLKKKGVGSKAKIQK